MTRTPDHTHLEALLAVVAHNLRAEIANHLAGHPRAQAYDTDRTTGGQGSDPTATAATTPDTARHDLDAHDQAVDRAYRALLTLAALSERYLPAHQPRRGTLQADTRPCTLHDRAGANTQHHHGKHRTDLGSYLDQPLKDPTDVCSACYEQIRRTGKIPTNDELIRHDRTGKWAVRTSGKREAVWTATNIAKDWEGAA